VLPLSQVGGYVVGARALIVAGVPGNSAAASTLADVTLEFIAQLGFVAIALGWLLYLEPGSRFAVPAALGLVAALALAAGFLVAQRRGFGAIDRLAGGFNRDWVTKAGSTAARLHAELAAIYGRWPRVWASFVVHLACWVASVCEVWLALRLMGAARGFGVVLIMESFLYALRSVAFAVPNGIGVQEGGYLLLGAGFGLAPETMLAVSLVKRTRDFVIGLPVLGLYQLVESGRLWRRASTVGGPHS
jgi:putative membrane protein